jgi:hypothetical protein
LNEFDLDAKRGSRPARPKRLFADGVEMVAATRKGSDLSSPLGDESHRVRESEE